MTHRDWVLVDIDKPIEAEDIKQFLPIVYQAVFSTLLHRGLLTQQQHELCLTMLEETRHRTQ